MALGMFDESVEHDLGCHDRSFKLNSSIGSLASRIEKIAVIVSIYHPLDGRSEEDIFYVGNFK